MTHLPEGGFAAARTEVLLLSMVVMPALAILIVCCSMACGDTDRTPADVRSLRHIAVSEGSHLNSIKCNNRLTKTWTDLEQVRVLQRTVQDLFVSLQ